MQSTHHHFGSLPGGTHHICAGIDRDVGISGAGSYIHSVRSINIDGAVTVHTANIRVASSASETMPSTPERLFVAMTA